MAARRTLLILVVVGGAVLVVVASFVVLFAVDYGTCSGDGGSPFSARDSVAGRFCDGPLETPWAAAMLVVPVGLAAGLGAWGVARRSGAIVAVAVGAGVAAILVLAVPVIALPSGCSGSDQRAYDRWVDGGRAGPRPADCETY
jgi:hypothetical protein